MFVSKIKDRKSGVLLYGITPPKVTTPQEKVQEIAEKTLQRLHGLDIDALIVYDVQDESERTQEERPFPYVSAMDPLTFASEYLAPLQKPKIIYRPAGKYTPEQLEAWLDSLHSHTFYPVFVGVPVPGFQVLTTLPHAYRLWKKHQASSVVGAITIPERHAALHDEPQRMIEKMHHGVEYFVSQCVFDLEFAKTLIRDLASHCASNHQGYPTLIFTLTAIGSVKTLQFTEWLGIHIPPALKAEMLESANILEYSVKVCFEIAQALAAECIDKGIPFGFNIESVAIRKEEIEASIHMTQTISHMLQLQGLR